MHDVFNFKRCFTGFNLFRMFVIVELLCILCNSKTHDISVAKIILLKINLCIINLCISN